MFIAEHLSPILIPLVNRFYRQNRARGKAKGNEQVWVTRHQGDIIAAARVADISGVDFLTGVQVDERFSGQGIATDLIKQLLSEQQKPLYSFPYEHLLPLYLKLGFVRLDSKHLPKPLQQRFNRYRLQGRDIVAAVFLNS